MPIDLSCPDCQSHYELPDEDAGQMVECACGTVLTVPGTPVEQPSVEVRCPKCGGRYHLPASDSGTIVECACGQQLKVPEATSPTDPSVNTENVETPTPPPSEVTEQPSSPRPEPKVESPPPPVQSDKVAEKEKTSGEQAAKSDSADTPVVLPIKCPGCQKRQNVPVSKAGEKVRCQCGASFRIPKDAARIAAERSQRKGNGSKEEGRKQKREPTQGSKSASPNQRKGKAKGKSARSWRSGAKQISADSTGAVEAAAPPSLGFDPDSMPTESFAPLHGSAAESNPSNKKGASAAGAPKSVAGSALRIVVLCLFALVGIGGIITFLSMNKRGSGKPEESQTLAKNDESSTDTNRKGNENEGAETDGEGANGGTTPTDEGTGKPVEPSDSTDPPDSSVTPDVKPNPPDAVVDAGPPPPMTDTGEPDNENRNGSGTPDKGTGETTIARVDDTGTTAPKGPVEPSRIGATLGQRSPRSGTTEPIGPVTPSTITEVLEPTYPEQRIDSFKEGLEQVLGTYIDVQLLESELQETNQEKPEVKQEFVEKLRLTAGQLEQTLQTINSTTPPDKLLQAELLLAFLNQKMNQNEKAAVLAGYVARKSKNDEVAQEAAKIAFSAQARQCQTAPDATVAAEERFLVKLGTLIETRWPDAEGNDEVRMTVAETLRLGGNVLDAAEWYQKISTNSPEQRHLGRVIAGNSLWSLHQVVRRIADRATPEEAPPIQAEADLYAQRAIALLRESLTQYEKQKEANLELILVAKLSRTQAELQANDAKTALGLITGKPNDLISAVAVEAGKPRPETGFQSRSFAATVYRSLLQAYVGTGDLDAAVETIGQLESLTDGGADSLTGLYGQLIREFEAELATAKAERAKGLAATMHLLLKKLAAQPSLSKDMQLWIAEKEYAMGIAQPTGEGAEYFSEAMTLYEKYLVSLTSGPLRPDPQRVLVVRLKLARSQMGAAEFEAAFTNFYRLLLEKPNSFDIQFDAANCLEQWGSIEGQEARLMEAIQGEVLIELPAEESPDTLALPPDDGKPKKSPVWGWGKLSQILDGMLREGKNTEDVPERLLATRYHIARCRMLYASASGTNDELARATFELKTFAKYHTLLEGEGWADLEAIYTELLEKQGSPVEPLRDNPQPEPEEPDNAPPAAPSPASEEK